MLFLSIKPFMVAWLWQNLDQYWKLDYLTWLPFDCRNVLHLLKFFFSVHSQLNLFYLSCWPNTAAVLTLFLHTGIFEYHSHNSPHWQYRLRVSNFRKESKCTSISQHKVKSDNVCQMECWRLKTNQNVINCTALQPIKPIKLRYTVPHIMSDTIFILNG